MTNTVSITEHSTSGLLEDWQPELTNKAGRDAATFKKRKRRMEQGIQVLLETQRQMMHAMVGQQGVGTKIKHYKVGEDTESLLHTFESS